MRPPRMEVPALLAAASVLVAGCGDLEARRFATPEATVNALFMAYGVEAVPEPAILARMQEGGRFVPEDDEAQRSCFADHRGPADEGGAGYVFGLLAAGKDHLVFDQDGDVARVYPTSRRGDDAPHVVLRRADSKWKIVLGESVPPEVRARLYQLYGHAEEQAARTGAPVGR